MTNRDLVQKAMPLASLTNEEWEEVNKHLAKQSGTLFNALQTLITNQSRIEVMTNYYDYYADTLDSPLRDCSVPTISI